MVDQKEIIANDIAINMGLDANLTGQLKNLIYIRLYDYSLVEVTNTDLAVTEENISAEIYRMFFIAKRVQGCTNKTLEYYKNVLKQFLTMITKPIPEITTNDIRYFLATKKERDRSSDCNIDNYRRVLNSFFSWAAEEEYIAKNPVARVKRVRIERYVKKAFKDVEVEKLRVNALGDVRLAALLEILLSTGCRISEIREMNIDDIDGDEVVIKGKGKKERYAYLNAKARIALERYLAIRTDNNNALFVSKNKPHRRLETSGMWVAIKDLGKTANVSDVHPHRFRRTAATMALNRGMPIDQVQVMLGHSNIETTTIYATSAQETVKASHKRYVV